MVITIATWEALKQASGRAKDLEHLDRYYESQRRDVFGILVQLHDHRGAATLHGSLTAVGPACALAFEASDAEHITELVRMLRGRLGAADFAKMVRHRASMSDGEIVDFIQERIAALTT